MMKTRNCSLQINSSGLDIDIAGNYNLIEISDQTIEYVISKNLEKLTGVLSQKNAIHSKFPTIPTFVKNTSSDSLPIKFRSVVSTFPTSRTISWAMKSNDICSMAYQFNFGYSFIVMAIKTDFHDHFKFQFWIITNF